MLMFTASASLRFLLVDGGHQDNVFTHQDSVFTQDGLSYVFSQFNQMYVLVK